MLPSLWRHDPLYALLLLPLLLMIVHPTVQAFRHSLGATPGGPPPVEGPAGQILLAFLTGLLGCLWFFASRTT